MRKKALPLSADMARAFAALSLSQKNVAQGLFVLLTFLGLLRVQESLGLVKKDIIFLDSGGMLVLLRETKTGRTATSIESVRINDEKFCQALRNFCVPLLPEQRLFDFDYAQVAAFTTHLGRFFGVSDPRLTSHTNRRGGATYFFQACGSYDLTQQQGRWSQLKTARLYIDGALADLSQQTLPEWGRSRLDLAVQALPAALAQLHEQ